MADRTLESSEIRRPRTLETRDAETRPTTWKPPSILPDPIPQPGFVYRWVRTATLGQVDNPNVSGKFREGWVPVRAEDHPEITIMHDHNSRFKGNIEIGGLLLCKIPKEIMDQRAAYHDELARRQLESVDQNFLRENDPRMPLFKERSSRTTFGRG